MKACKSGSVVRERTFSTSALDVAATFARSRRRSRLDPAVFVAGDAIATIIAPILRALRHADGARRRAQTRAIKKPVRSIARPPRSLAGPRLPRSRVLEAAECTGLAFTRGRSPSCTLDIGLLVEFFSLQSRLQRVIVWISGTATTRLRGAPGPSRRDRAPPRPLRSRFFREHRTWRRSPHAYDQRS